MKNIIIIDLVNKINRILSTATRTVACTAVAWFRLPREIRGEAGRGITVKLSSSLYKKTASYLGHHKSAEIFSVQGHQNWNQIYIQGSLVSGTTRLQRTGLSFIRDKGERLVDAKTKKTIFNLALQSEAVTVKKQAAHQTRQAQKY